MGSLKAGHGCGGFSAEVSVGAVAGQGEAGSQELVLGVFDGLALRASGERLGLGFDFG